MSAAMTQRLAECLAYAARGWHVFPCKPNAKIPATGAGGFYNATTNPAALRRWFRWYPYNIGIRTGAASRIFIFDVDGEAGSENLREIEFQHGRLPLTLISTTGQGRHFWFIADRPIPCSTGRIAPGIDVRADGGYVVAPSSIHPNGKLYQWIDYAIPPAAAPDWLIRLAMKPAPAPRPTPAPRSRQGNGNGEAYGAAALAREAGDLAHTMPGTRNHALNRAAFKMFQLVAGGELERSEVEARLFDACATNGLLADDGERAVRKTIASGARAGMAYPRTRGADHD
jgi:hypothetical protein